MQCYGPCRRRGFVGGVSRPTETRRAHLTHAHTQLCRRHHHHLYCYNTKYFAAFFPCACRLHVCLSAELERALLVPHLRLIPELRPRHSPLASRLPSSVRRLFAEHQCRVPVHARVHASDARHAHGVPREGDLQTPEPQLEVVFLAARAVRVSGVARRGEFRHCSWCVACGVLGRRCARRRAGKNVVRAKMRAVVNPSPKGWPAEARARLMFASNARVCGFTY